MGCQAGAAHIAQYVQQSEVSLFTSDIWSTAPFSIRLELNMRHILWRRPFSIILVAVLMVALLMLGLLFHSESSAQLPVHEAIRYAQDHWDWAVYNNPTDRVKEFDWQSNFQCAEFVARSIASVNPISDLTADTEPSRLGSILYGGKPYNVLSVAGLYNFLIDTGVGRDVGADKSSATLGSAVVYGDFDHVTIVTSRDLLSDAKVSAHNQAMLDYPIDQLVYDKSNRMPITHIVQVNYTKIAGGAFSSVTVPKVVPITMLSPAPYHGAFVASDVQLAWQPLSNAKGYEITVWNVWGQFVTGASTQNTSWTVAFSMLPYGVYNYSIQPLSDIASIPAFFDAVNYEPEWCMRAPRSPDCGSASGMAASAAGASTVLGMLVITQPEVPILRPAQTHEITVTVQNTGRLVWPNGKVKLVNSSGPGLGIGTLPLPEILPGTSVQIPLVVVAPQKVGVYDSAWRLSFFDQPFGEEIHITVFVTPNGNNIDLNSIIQAMLDDIQRSLAEQFGKVWDEVKLIIERRIQEALRDLQKWLSSNCGIGPAAIMLASGILWRQRTRRREKT